MSKEFPDKCVRCGFCCLSTACPLAIEYIPGAEENKPCPALEFERNGIAKCGLYAKLDKSLRGAIGNVLGFGKGCCTAAMMLNTSTGKTVNFSSMKKGQKQAIVRGIIENKVGLIKGKKE